MHQTQMVLGDAQENSYLNPHLKKEILSKLTGCATLLFAPPPIFTDLPPALMSINVFYLTGNQKRKDLLRFSKFGQIRKKTSTGQRKSKFKEHVVGKFTIVMVATKKTLDLVKTYSQKLPISGNLGPRDADFDQ